MGDTIPCSRGGTLTVTANLSSPDLIGGSDTLSILAESCSEDVEGVTETMIGQMSIRITSGHRYLNGNPYPLRIGMQVTYTGFSIVQAGTRTTVAGDMDISIDQDSSTRGSIQVRGTALNTTIVTPVGGRSYTLKDYGQVLSMNGAETWLGMACRVETTNPRLGGAPVRYYMFTSPGFTTDANGAPSGGALEVMGSKSALLLQRTGMNGYDIQVDANGDDTFESTMPTTLDELDAQL